jgi:hypothetical protein
VLLVLLLSLLVTKVFNQDSSKLSEEEIQKKLKILEDQDKIKK